MPIGDTGSYIPTNTNVNVNPLDLPFVKGEGLQVKGSLLIGDAITASKELGGLTPNQEILNKLRPDKPPVEFNFDEHINDAGDPVKMLKANVWFSPNMMVALTMNLTEMAMQMKENRLVELTETLQSMNTVWESAQSEKEMILAAGAAESMMKEVEGAAGVMTAAGGAFTAGLAGHATFVKDSQLHGFMIQAGGGQAVSSIVSGSSQAVSGFINSALTLQKAAAEAEKEIQSTLKQLQNQVLQSANDARKELEDVITKALDTLKNINEQITKALANFLPRN